MLVLSRKPKESILIGPHIKVTVLRIGPRSVRIGIDAPSELGIVREELTLQIDGPQVVDVPLVPALAEQVA